MIGFGAMLLLRMHAGRLLHLRVCSLLHQSLLHPHELLEDRCCT